MNLDLLTKIFFMTLPILMLIGGIHQYNLYRKGYGTQKANLMFSGYFRKPKEATKLQRKLLLLNSLFSIILSVALLVFNFFVYILNVKFRT